MKKRKRNILDDKKLVNLYIRYMRDYLEESSFINIKAIRQEDKLNPIIYAKPLQLNHENHKMLRNKQQILKDKLKNEKDSLEIVYLKKELEKIKPYIERIESCSPKKPQYIKKTSILSKIIEPYDNKGCIDLYPEDYNNIYDKWSDEDEIINVQGLDIFVDEIKKFDYHIYLISELFGLDTNSESKTNIILKILLLNHFRIEQNHSNDGWKEKFIKVNSAAKYINKSGLLNNIDRIDINKVTNNDAKWLLECRKRFKESYQKDSFQIKKKNNYSIKALILHETYVNWFDIDVAKMIVKNSKYS